LEGKGENAIRLIPVTQCAFLGSG